MAGVESQKTRNLRRKYIRQTMQYVEMQEHAVTILISFFLMCSGMIVAIIHPEWSAIVLSAAVIVFLTRALRVQDRHEKLVKGE